MLFHSQVFLLAFLPLTLGVYYLLAEHHKARIWILIIASLGFYGYWDLRNSRAHGRHADGATRSDPEGASGRALSPVLSASARLQSRSSLPGM
jgi:hypothetical protein